MKKILIALFATLTMNINIAQAAVTIVRVAPVTTVRVAPTVRISQPVRVSPTPKSVLGKNSGNSLNSSPIPLYIPLIIAATSSNASASESSKEIATPMLTICSIEEAEKAKVWQEDCKNIAEYSNDVSASHCPILSYFRYCKEATPDEIKGLKPLKANYKHVYLKE